MQSPELEICVKVFVSYAHEDQEYHQKLLQHLSLLMHSGKITIWHDQELLAGVDWENQINTRLSEADIILLLISANFLASKYCWNKEFQVALSRHKRGEAWIIPIIVKPVDWRSSPLGQFQVLPTGSKPVTQWNDLEAAFEDVVQGIRKVVEQSQVTLHREAKVKELRSEVFSYIHPDLMRLNKERKDIASRINEQKRSRKALEAEIQAINMSIEENRKEYRLIMNRLLQLEKGWMEKDEQIQALSNVSLMFPIEFAEERMRQSQGDLED